jgi:hypothetical protein
MAQRIVSIEGGDKLKRHLAAIAAKLSTAGAVKVGFFKGATYPADAKKNRKGGLPVAQVAFWNEFGTSRAPPRPFFRGMIAKNSPQWGEQMATVAKANEYDATATLNLMGEGIKDQLVKSINDFQDPGLAPSTIARKGFSKPLIDTAVMIRHVGYEVTTEDAEGEA